MSDEQDTQEPVIDTDRPDTEPDDEIGGLVPNSVRESIAGEPGPADPELRSKALDPAEAAVDVEDDPAANQPPNEVPAPDPDATDTGDEDTGEPADTDETGADDAGDPLDDVEDGEVVDLSTIERQQTG